MSFRKTIAKEANKIARENGYHSATYWCLGDEDKVIKRTPNGYRKKTTHEYVPNAYRNNFGWKNTYYQPAITKVMVNIKKLGPVRILFLEELFKEVKYGYTGIISGMEELLKKDPPILDFCIKYAQQQEKISNAGNFTLELKCLKKSLEQSSAAAKSAEA